MSLTGVEPFSFPSWLASSVKKSEGKSRMIVILFFCKMIFSRAVWKWGYIALSTRRLNWSSPRSISIWSHLIITRNSGICNEFLFPWKDFWRRKHVCLIRDQFRRMMVKFGFLDSIAMHAYACVKTLVMQLHLASVIIEHVEMGRNLLKNISE